MSGRGTCARVAVGDASARRAFSLIEILVSILILSLGLLGLGALFPVVIREQRLGTDAINGLIVANSAKAMLTGVDWTKQATTPPPNGAPSTVWGLLRQDTTRGALGSSGSPDYHEAGGWWVPEIDTTSVSATSLQGRITTPAYTFRLKVPLEYRLYPAPGSGQPPQYVWDFALRRDVSSSNERLLMAVFVRRIDPGIRLPPRSDKDYDRLTELSKSLLNVKALKGTGPEARLPVGEDQNGRQTGDGTDGAGGTQYYSNLRRARVSFKSAGIEPLRDRLYYEGVLGVGDIEQEWEHLGQSNQRIIDNLGNVYSVIGTDTDARGRYLKLEPNIPPSVTTTRPTGALVDPLFSVMYTPQVPVSVQVFEVKP